ncbi:hypothetical protein [Streptomyces yangpuensis]|uniref:hypothetical protein n=1 Tax=Streptomyces yangpuensis TaxID=1648182 RepID=UPI0037F77220
MLVSGLAAQADGGARVGTVMHRLQGPEGYTLASAELLNNAGQVAGTARNPWGPVVHLRWEADGSFTRLADLGGSVHGAALFARDLNDRGIIAGDALTPDQQQHAATWDATGAIRRLEEPADFLHSSAVDVNDSGVAVGYVGRYSTTRAVRWDRDGRATFLEELPDALRSNVYRINDSGEAIGEIAFSQWHFVGVRWDAAGKLKVLKSVDGPASGVDINNRGTIAGASYDPTTHTNVAARALRCCDFRPMQGASPDSRLMDVNNRDVFLGYNKNNGKTETVRWDNTGGMTVLRPALGATDMTVYQLNDSGVGVGHSDNRAAYWDASGVGQYLPVPSNVSGSYGHKINNSGQILGSAWVDGSLVGVVWK